MSRSYAFAVLAAFAPFAVTSLAASGCSIPLDAGREPAPEPTLATSPGCALFAGNLAPSGAARSAVAADGSALWVLDGESGNGTASFSLTAGASTDDCLAAARGPVTPALQGEGPDTPRTVMSLVSSPAGARLYFEELEPAPGEPFGVRTRGFGVAEEIPGTGRFQASPTLVWAGDRPRYGTAAVVKGDDVYAFGCVDAGFLAADCYVARAPVASMADEAAYSYYEGSGRFTSDPARAWPVVRGAGTSLAVAWSPARNRYLMVYATPLGKTWHARTGLSPEGPWSDDHEIAAADLGGDGDAFVVGVALHPELLAGDRARIAVTYALAAFSADFEARKAASPARLGPKLTLLALPDDLP